MKLTEIEKTLLDHKLILTKRSIDIYNKEGINVFSLKAKKSSDLVVKENVNKLGAFILKIYHKNFNPYDLKRLNEFQSFFYQFYSYYSYDNWVSTHLEIKDLESIPSNIIDIYEIDEYGRDFGHIAYMKVTSDMFVNKRGLRFDGTIYDNYKLNEIGIDKVEMFLKDNYETSFSFKSWKFISKREIEKMIIKNEKIIKSLQSFVNKNKEILKEF